MFYVSKTFLKCYSLDEMSFTFQMSIITSRRLVVPVIIFLKILFIYLFERESERGREITEGESD